MEALLIFEGGGAKGFAHIGALKAFEDLKIPVGGVAGTSAGSIIAALVSVGYSSSELISDTALRKSPLNRDFLEFFDPGLWSQWLHMKSGLSKISTQGIPGAFSAYLTYRSNKELLEKLQKDKGIFGTDQFEDWLEALLQEKIPPGPSGKVRFSDLRIPLKVVATDTNNGSIRVFDSSDSDNANLSVSRAVSASIAIPGFFVPVDDPLTGSKLVDGGLVSNYPAWLFDKERRDQEARLVTIGFRLVNRSTGDTTNKNFLGNLVNSALWGDQHLEIREIENLHSVPIEVDHETTDFDLDFQGVLGMIDAGYQDAKLKLNSSHLIDFARMSEHLEVVRNHMRVVMFEQHMSSTAEDFDIDSAEELHLRCNVILPAFADKSRLSIMYHSGMEDDPPSIFQLKRTS